MIDDLKESRREKLIVKSVIVLVCVGTDDDIWVHRSNHSLSSPTAEFLCVFGMIVTTFGGRIHENNTHKMMKPDF